MSRAWIITKDCLAENDSFFPSEVGVTGPRDAPDEMIEALKKGDGYAFVMKDDDGEIYYRGRCMWSDDEDIETGCYGPLGDFGGPNAGCTSIDYVGHPEFNCG